MSQYSRNNAWYQDFENGNSNNNDKDNELRARPVRRFKPGQPHAGHPP